MVEAVEAEMPSVVQGVVRNVLWDLRDEMTEVVRERLRGLIDPQTGVPVKRD